MTDAADRYNMLYFDLILLQADPDLTEEAELEHAEKMDAEWRQMTFDDQEDFRRILAEETVLFDADLGLVDQRVEKDEHILPRKDDEKQAA